MIIIIINQGQDLLDQQEQSHLVDFNESIGKASRNSSPQIVGKYLFDQEDNDNGIDLLAYVRIVDLYSTSIINHMKMKITTCGHGNTLMVCIEHRWTIFYQEEKLRVQKEK